MHGMELQWSVNESTVIQQTRSTLETKLLLGEVQAEWYRKAPLQGNSCLKTRWPSRAISRGLVLAASFQGLAITHG